MLMKKAFYCPPALAMIPEAFPACVLCSSPGEVNLEDVTFDDLTI